MVLISVQSVSAIIRTKPATISTISYSFTNLRNFVLPELCYALALRRHYWLTRNELCTRRGNIILFITRFCDILISVREVGIAWSNYCYHSADSETQSSWSVYKQIRFYKDSNCVT